ncbi:MAG: ABC transporter ATP-binding protein [Gemmatimonadales bacterium]|nr:ABC transporter ATP-binding protein [Gemmatimonadales bacterium]
MTAPALEVRGLSVPFGDAPGLRDIGFTLDPGERLVLLGASGAGKTTLLRAIAGLAPLAAGRLTVGGQDVTARPAESRDAVYLHQTPLLFPHLSIFENVAFPLRIRGYQDSEIRASVAELLESVRLDGLAGRRPHTLSGGQKHRAALARAMAARPAVLLLDEPLAALDPSLRDEVRATLLSLQAHYRPALVIVTHDLEDAAVLGDRIGILLGGTLAQLDQPDRLFQRPASLAVARFLGLPNLVAGSVAAGQFQSALGLIPVEAESPSGPATAAFGTDALRPEPCGSLQGIVRSVQYGPRGATLRVDVAGIELEVVTGAGAIPHPGDELSLGLERDRVTILPGIGDV